jgi:CubicO group peptidase (beta-lactamase class C family)
MIGNVMRRGAAAGLLVMGLAGSEAHAQKAVAAKLERYMDGQAKFHGFSGAVLVMKDDKVLLRKAYGLADREWGTPNTADTRFRIASISKPFTAVAVLQLAEQGKLSLDDPLEKFIPGFPDGDRITLHLMLSHQSGLPATSHADASMDMGMTREKVVELLKAKPLAFAPGTREGYSNTAYLLLSYIVESVSGETFASFIQKHVLDPAGLRNTGVYDPEEIVAKRARHYWPERTPRGIVFRNESWRNYRLLQGHGSLYSTVDDVARFLGALRGDTLLSPAWRTRMMTPQREGSGSGYGLRLDPVAGKKAFGHAGRFSGAWANALAFPEEGVVTVILSNNLSNADSLNHELAALTFGEDVVMPYRHVRVGIDPALLDRYAGRYGRGEIVSRDGKLMAGNTELVPESRVKFFEDSDPNNTYEFLVDAQGKVTGVVFTSYSVKETVSRNE